MPRVTRRRCVRLALLAATASPVACSMTLFGPPYAYHATVIAPPSLPSSAEQGERSATLEVESLRISILSLDVAPEGEPAPRLALRLGFEPREIGYSFDPGQIALRGPDGAEWHPRVRGPGQLDTCMQSCQGNGDDPAGREPRYSFLLPKTCFILSFEVAVEPATQWELVLAGLARGKRRLDPVVLRLSRASWEAPTSDYDSY